VGVVKGNVPWNSANKAIQNAYISTLYQFNLSVWAHSGLVQLALSFAVLGGLVLASILAAPKLKRFDRRVPVPRAVGDTGLLVAMGGFTVFLVYVFIDIAISFPPVMRGEGALHAFILLPQMNWLWGFYANYTHLAYLTLPESFGVQAFYVLAAGTFGAFVYHLKGGILSALAKAITLLWAPAVMVLTFGLLLLAPEYMPLQATKFLIGSPYAGILTNWFALALSSGLFAFMIIHRRLIPTTALLSETQVPGRKSLVLAKTSAQSTG